MAERYSFPILKVDEIRDTMNELQINLTNDDLTQPAGWKVKQIYEQLIELLLNQRREDMAQPALSGLDELDYPELHEESIPMIAFLKAWCAPPPPARRAGCSLFRNLFRAPSDASFPLRVRSPLSRPQLQAALDLRHHRLQARRHQPARPEAAQAQPLRDHQLRQVPRGPSAGLRRVHAGDGRPRAAEGAPRGGE